MQDLEPGSGSQGGQDAELEEGEIGGFDHCHHPNPTITICLPLLDTPITSVQEIQVPELYQNNPFKNTAVWRWKERRLWGAPLNWSVMESVDQTGQLL